MSFSIERNDLAVVKADAVVVAANENLQITGGVGLAVAKAAGIEKLQAACDEIAFCSCGCAVATPAFDLDSKCVVHAVGPSWHGGEQNEVNLLRSAYDSAFDIALAQGARSIAFPLISAGTYGFPADVALTVAREAARVFLNQHEDVKLKLVLYSREAIVAGMDVYPDIVEYINDRYVEDEFNGLSRLPVHGSRFPPAMSRRIEGDRTLTATETEQIAFAPCSKDSDDAALPHDSMSIHKACGMSVGHGSLEELLDELDEPFSTTLLALIDERGMTDAQVYKRANMSRQLFSKIRTDANYRPSKKTALALAVALGLDLDETRDLLARAGYALTHSSKADLIVEYFIARKEHDIFKINETLFAFDQPLL